MEKHVALGLGAYVKPIYDPVSLIAETKFNPN